MSDVSERTKALLQSTYVWDNHACMPLRPNDETYLPQLARPKRSGVTVLSLNVYFDIYPPEIAISMLASMRHWISKNADDYLLIDSIADIEAAKAAEKMGVVFDIEGGRAVEAHPGLVEVFYKLGVRWMLIAYNRNNRLGGGCQDDDCGLTDYGRIIIDEMERVGMVVCCSHTGYETARQVMDYAKNPVIFSHSNPLAVKSHPRNIPDDLMQQCARMGGVVNLNGIGPFLGNNDNETDTLLRHIDYAVDLLGPAHVGLGLDYVFDQEELRKYIKSNPDVFPPQDGYDAGMRMIEPERIPIIAEELLKRGYKDSDVQGILGHNNMRVAKGIWK